MQVLTATAMRALRIGLNPLDLVMKISIKVMRSVVTTATAFTKARNLKSV